MDQLASLKAQLSPELWSLLIAFLAGAAARVAKRWLPASVLPAISILAGAVLNGLSAIALAEPVLGALLVGATAGGVSVGGHELAKKVLGRFLGEPLAERLLGVSRDKLAPSKEEKR